MAIKGEIATRADMNGEFTPTENTDLLFNFKQIPENYSNEIKSVAWEQDSYPADGFPRSFLDGINEDAEDVALTLESSSGFTVSGIYQTSNVSGLFGTSTTKVTNLSICNLTSTGNLTADTGSDRSISLFFKPITADLSGTATIFTQRISSDRGYHLGILNGRLYTRAYDSSGNYVWNSYVTYETLSTSTWYHVIITHDATRCRVYLNGVKRLDFIHSGGTIDYIRPYAFGNMLGGGYDFQGYIRSFYVSTYDWESEAIAFGQTARTDYSGIPSSASINTSGTWSIHYDFYGNYVNDRALRTSSNGSYFELTYYGNKIEPYVRKYSLGGLVDVYIDDVFIEQVDTYSASDNVAMLGSYEQTTKGNHTIKLLYNDTSSYLTIDYFDIYDINYIVGVHGTELHLDQYNSWHPKEISFAFGFPRWEIDDNSELGRHYQRYNRGYDSDVVVSKGAFFKTVTTFLNKSIKVLDFSNGGTVTYDAPTSDGMTQRVFGVWFKPTAVDIASGSHAVCGQRLSSNRGYYLGVNGTSGGIYVRGYDSTGTLILSYDPTTADVVLVANQWYFFCLVHDSTNWDIYLNGGLVNSGTYSGTIDYTTNGFKLGTATSTDSFQFYGQVGAFFLDYMEDVYWNSTIVENIYDNMFSDVRLYPTCLEVVAYEGDDWEYIQETTNNYKYYYSDTLNDSVTLRYTGTYLSLHACKDTDGGVFEIYVDGVLDDTIDLYASARSEDNLVWYYSTSIFHQKTVDIMLVNTSGGVIRINEIVTHEGYNHIINDATKENDFLNWYSDFTDAYSNTFRDNVLGSKYEFKLVADKADYPDSVGVRIDTTALNGLGDKWFLGGVISPVVSVTEEIFPLIGHSPGTDNSLIKILYHQDPVTSFTDGVIIDGDFIAEDERFAYLDPTHYYFIGVLVDDDVDETWLIVFDLTDSVVIVSETYPFITSTTYPRDTFNNLYINYSYSSAYGSGEIDSFIFEANTEETTATILEKLYTLSYATGADQDTPTNVLTCYNLEPKLTLRKTTQTAYVSTGIYYSRVINIGELDGSGKLNICKDLPLGTSITDIQTRTSDDVITDTPTWSSWEDVSDIGIIASPNRKYIQIKFTMNASTDLSKSPSVTSMQIIDVDPVPWERKAFSYPITYTSAGVKEFILSDATNLHQIIELNGANFITFDMPYSSDGTQYITAEKYIRLFDDYYIVRKITVNKASGKAFIKVYAEALFYNLQKSIPLSSWAFYGCSPSTIIEGILANTGWELLECDITISRDFQFEDGANVLEQLREVQKLFGGDLIFDNQKRQVSLLEESTEDNGVIFAYKKNMENITKVTDSTNLANRIYVYGEDNLSIENVNNGLEYVTNDISSYVPDGTIFCKTVANSYFSDEDQLLDYANYVKHDYESPEITYSLKAKDFSVLQQLDLSYNVGDTVTVFDEELEIELSTRIIAVDYNILVPQESEITLSSILRTVGDEISELKKYQDRLRRLSYFTWFNLIKWYLQDRVRTYGWVNAEYVKTSGTVAVGTTGTINLENVKSFTNIRTLASYTGSIVGRLLHGDTITITEISEDEDWYKINYSI